VTSGSDVIPSTKTRMVPFGNFKHLPYFGYSPDAINVPPHALLHVDFVTVSITK